MKKIIEYKLCTSNSIDDLTWEVNKALRDGFHMHKKLIVTDAGLGGVIKYFREMVKYKEDGAL